MAPVTPSLAARLRARWQDPAVRRHVGLFVLAKAIGLAILVALISKAWLPEALQAQDAAPLPTPTINALNAVWTLVAAALVFGMQVGFVMLEAGFARSREAVNVLVAGIADTCLCGITFWLWGFAFLFGEGTPWIGTTGFALQGLPATYGATGIPLLAFWVFQFAFADTCSTITSGAMIGRCSFVGDLLYSVVVTGFLYPIVGHWVWGPDGWLATLGFRDFAGSTVVHTIGGAISLAGAIALGPRLGRVFKRDGGGPMPAHDLILGAAGGLLLWFGWYGFNAGSTLSAMDTAGIGRVAFNTTLAACAGGLTALAVSWVRTRKWDLALTTNGFLAGLVAITAPCYWVDPVGGFAIGLVAGFVVCWGIDLLEHLRIDDPIGAVPVHMFCGVWGTLAVGLFAAGKYGAPTPTGEDVRTVLTGLFYGGGVQLLGTQFLGAAAVTGTVLAASLALMFALRAAGVLRVSTDGELEGIDLHEHGSSAYPEYLISGSESVILSVSETGKPADPSWVTAEMY